MFMCFQSLANVLNQDSYLFAGTYVCPHPPKNNLLKNCYEIPDMNDSKGSIS